MTQALNARMIAVRDKFLARCRQERAQLGPLAGLTEDELGRIGQAAHKIAGLAGTLGFVSLGDAAVQVDRLIASHANVGPAYLRYVEELNKALVNRE